MRAWTIKQLATFEQRLCARFAVAARAPVTTPTRDGAALLAAVHLHPDDDAARAVYADWLTEQGDAHGEFITLQLQEQRSPDASLRAMALLKKPRPPGWASLSRQRGSSAVSGQC
jgi:uncharacterized protein (TIGR02996 family)